MSAQETLTKHLKQLYNKAEFIITPNLPTSRVAAAAINARAGEAIKKLSAEKNTVIATGGGAILNPESVRLLRENGRIYFLDRPLEWIIPTDDRPTASSREALKRRYEERYPIYSSVCDVHLKTLDEAEENAEWIKEDFLK